MLFLSLIVASLQFLFCSSLVTQQSSISAATQNNLNALLLNAYNRAMVMLTLTNEYPNVPLSQPLFFNYVNFTGTNQQALWGNVVSIPYTRAAYYALSTGAVQMYNINMQYGYVPNAASTTSCPAGINSGSAAAPCRSIYHYDRLGWTATGSTPLKSASYSATTRPWYTQAVSRGKLGWSTIFTFATSNGNQQVTGVTLSGPWYQGNTNTVISVVAVDVDYSQITPILQQYAVDGTVTYLVETSSYDLVATSSGELPVSGTTVITCTAAKNPAVKNTCTYLTGSTFGSTWAPDGDYQATIGGVSYVMNIVSITDPQTSTLAWKMIVVGLGSALPTTNYIPTLYESLDYTITDIKNRMSTVQTIPNYLEFLSGAHPSAPLDVNIIQRTDPSLTGISQQATWSAFNVFKSMGNIVVAIALAYQANGTYLSYAYNPDGTYYYAYRPPQAQSSCAAITGYPGYSSSCLQEYYVNANGVPTTAYYQGSYDPRSRPWYTAAQSTGVGTWSSEYYAALSSTYIYQLGFSIPIFDPTTELYSGQVVAAYNFNTDWTNIINRYATSGSGYVAYVFDVRNGNLMANNVGAPIFSTSTNTFILATQSSNTVIKNSANYISVNGFISPLDVTTAYNTTYDMTIVAESWMDSTQTFSGYVVYVQLTPSVDTSPTAAPTSNVYSSSSASDDDKVETARAASIAASVLAAVLIVLVIVVIVLLVSANKLGQRGPSAPAATEMVMTPMPKSTA